MALCVFYINIWKSCERHLNGVLPSSVLNRNCSACLKSQLFFYVDVNRWLAYQARFHQVTKDP